MSRTFSSARYRTKPAEQFSEAEKIRRAEYMQLLQLHNDNRIDYNVRKWENLKFFQGIVLAILAAALVGLTTILDKKLHCQSSGPALLLGITFLALIAFYAAKAGTQNLLREGVLLLDEEVSVFKIAKYLGLDKQILERQRQWFPGDSHLLSFRWREWKKNPETDIYARDLWHYLNIRSENNGLYIYCKKLFRIEQITAIFLVVASLFFLVTGLWGSFVCERPPESIGVIIRRALVLIAGTI